MEEGKKMNESNYCFWNCWYLLLTCYFSRLMVPVLNHWLASSSTYSTIPDLDFLFHFIDMELIHMDCLRSWGFLAQDLCLFLETFCPTERCVLSSIVNILQLSRQLSVFVFPRNGIVGPTHTCPLYPRPLLSAVKSLRFASSDSQALLAESA